MRRVACLALCALSRATEGAELADLSALVQLSAGQRAVLPSRGSAVGPVVSTGLGLIRGERADDHDVFRGIPYAEPPERFARAASKKPWTPRVLDATGFRPGCIGSQTAERESEDCLYLNVWLPRGSHEGLPVIVYFHGGMNQHGSGSESLRQGDGITQSKRYPAVFVNFDYRLGIFGWIHGENLTSNLGFHDQQAALQWVHENIAAFGGNPASVTLMGQSEGAGNILAHLVSPRSGGLFHRVILHSPPADVWSRQANREHTAFTLRRVGCHGRAAEALLQCLKKVPADRLWRADWVAEDISRDVLSSKWTQAVAKMLAFMASRGSRELVAHLGWHPVVDGTSVPGEPRVLIPLGRWHRVPVLITVSKNESLGVVPGGPAALQLLRSALSALSAKGDLRRLERLYAGSLASSGISAISSFDLLHQMLTDKMWTCEAWNLAREITKGGGKAQVGMFWHTPRYDPVGAKTNSVCMLGATCHAAEMLYSLPQGHGRGICGTGPVMQREVAFMERYRDEVLAFVHGLQGPWVAHAASHEAMTFYDEHGPRVVEGYRKRQCAILDGSVPETAPSFVMQRRPGTAGRSRVSPSPNL